MKSLALDHARDNEVMLAYAHQVCARMSREDAAASVQAATERVIAKAVNALQARTGLRALALSGGVFANVRLNRTMLEETAADRVFVFPAMGDDGLPVGGALLYLLERDGAAAWQRARYRLDNVYLGRDHDARFAAAGQTCVAGSRAFFQKGIYDRLVARLVDRAKTIRLGDPLKAASCS